MAGIAAMMAGNLTNATLAAMNVMWPNQASAPNNVARLDASLRLAIGFFGGCVLAATAVAYGGDWAWSFPVALAGVAALMR